MKEVEFRTIDRLFIKMSINDKMWAIFAIFIVAVAALAGGRYTQTLDTFEQTARSTAEQQIIAMAKVADLQQLNALSNVKQINGLQPAAYNDGIVTATAKAQDGQIYQLTLNRANDLQQLKSEALTSFALSFLWALPFALFC